MGYAVLGISVKAPSLNVNPTMLPDASKIDAAETGERSVALITRSCALAAVVSSISAMIELRICFINVRNDLFYKFMDICQIRRMILAKIALGS